MVREQQALWVYWLKTSWFISTSTARLVTSFRNLSVSHPFPFFQSWPPRVPFSFFPESHDCRTWLTDPTCNPNPACTAEVPQLVIGKTQSFFLQRSQKKSRKPFNYKWTKVREWKKALRVLGVFLACLKAGRPFAFSPPESSSLNGNQMFAQGFPRCERTVCFLSRSECLRRLPGYSVGDSRSLAGLFAVRDLALVRRGYFYMLFGRRCCDNKYQHHAAPLRCLWVYFASGRCYNVKQTNLPEWLKSICSPQNSLFAPAKVDLKLYCKSFS